MKNKAIISFFIIVALIGIGAGYWYLKSPKNSALATISEEDAVEAIKNRYPELKDYPNEKLPPQSIKADKAKAGDGWYVSFIQEGSGIPIISARCFFVDNHKAIMGEKTYKPAGEDVIGEFSPLLCAPDNTVRCGIENCHGLDIKCGPNPAQVCTEIYQLGDKCRQYAKCGVQDGTCRLGENPDFTACKACVEACEKNNTDPMSAFECESECK